MTRSVTHNVAISADHISDAFQEGKLVVVVAEVQTDDEQRAIIPVGTVGRIVKIDDDGDAALDFGHLNEVVYKKQFSLPGVVFLPALRYVELPADQDHVSEKWIYNDKFHHLIPLPPTHIYI